MLIHIIEKLIKHIWTTPFNEDKSEKKMFQTT